MRLARGPERSKQLHTHFKNEREFVRGFLCSTFAMECVALDSSSSPPPAQSNDGVSAASSSSSSVDGPLARYIGSAAAGSKKIASDSSSASSRSSGSSDISSSVGGDFLSKFVSSEAATIQPQAPTSAAVSDAAFPRKEQKSSYRTIRYFDEADASIT